MADINNLVPKILKWEGQTFTDDPTDEGGATKDGVTLTTWKSIGYDKNGDHAIDVNDLKLLTVDDFKFVLKVGFWDVWKADSIKNQSIANCLVDWFWGSGRWGIVIPQRILGVTPDGIAGVGTLTALNNANQQDFFNKLIAERTNFINDIVKQSIAAYEKKLGRASTGVEQLQFTNLKFKQGWLNRLKDFSTFVA